MTTGLWVVAALVAEGTVTVTDDGTVTAVVPTRPSCPPGEALIDARLGDGLADWAAMASILADRPYEPSAEFYQSFDTFDTLKRRLALLDRHNDLHGRSLLQLGDDEMFSVALAMSPGVGHVHVADADPRVLKAIDEEASARGLPVTVYQVDVLRDRLPVTAVDTFFVSGLKDAGGLLLFITSALAATSETGATGYISYDTDVYRAGATDAEVHREVWQALDRLGCTVTALLPCDELMLATDFRADLAAITREAAGRGLSPAELSESLRHLADSPRADLFTAKPGFPDIALRPATLARVETGPQSARLARRQLRFLQSAVR
ncbi:bis-aminopropyl spermidine synthase family protein [Micromonospora chokoriensis]